MATQHPMELGRESGLHPCPGLLQPPAGSPAPAKGLPPPCLHPGQLGEAIG